MSKYAIEDTTLTAIGDALRGKLGETRKGMITEIVHHPEESQDMIKVAKTSNATGFTTYSGDYENNLNDYQVITIPGAVRVSVAFSYQTENMNYDYLYIVNGDYSGQKMPSTAEKFGGNVSLLTYNRYFTDDTVTFYFVSDISRGGYLGYYAEVTGYDADGNVIQEVTPAWDEEVEVEGDVPNTYKPGDMAAAIESIEVGGGSATANTAIVDSPVLTVKSTNYRATSYLTPVPYSEKNSMIIVVEMRNLGSFSGRTCTGISSNADYVKAFSSTGGYSNMVLISYNGITGTTPSITTTSNATSYQYSTHAIINVRNIDVSSPIVETFSSAISSSTTGKKATVTFNSAYNDYKKIVIFTEGCFAYDNKSFVNSDYLYPIEENSGFERLPGTVTANAYSSSYTQYVGTVVWTQTAETTLDSVSIDIQGGSVGTTLRGFVIYYKTPEEA